jgi:glycosyltransferase
VRRKLLFITTRLFWPTDSGRKLSLYYYCKGIYEKYNCDIYIYSFLESGQTVVDLKDKPDFIKEVKIASPITLVEKVRNLLFKTILTFQWPIQCSLYYSRKNAMQIEQFCNVIQPDFIFTDMIRTSMYYHAFNGSKALKVLDMDDLLSARYKRQLCAQYTSNISGQYTSRLPKFFQKIIGNSFFKNLILKIESNLIEKAELYYSNLYDKVIFVSQLETDCLNKKIPNKAITIPVGINAIKDLQLETRYEKNMLTFVGNMKVAANIDSLEWIVDNILPKIQHDIRLLVIGACPEYIKEQYEDNEKVVFTGRVDDLTSYVRKGQIFLSPILYGTGIKTKILEAMSMGVPIVTNDVGVEGIDVKNGNEIWVENNPEKIANKVDELLDNYDLALQVAQRAKIVVEEKYEWNKIWHKFSYILEMDSKS